MNSAKRNAYMDFLKGIAIVAMVMGHCISDIPKEGILCNVIYSFHMPLLMFVSAYIEEQNREKYAEKEWKMLLKRAGGLLIPYISWSFLYELFFGQIWEINIENFMLQLSGYRQSGLWFFPVLFGLKILHCFYWQAQKVVGKHNLIKDVLICCLLGIVTALAALLTKQPYIINMISYMIPYFLAVIVIDNEMLWKMTNSEWMTAGVFLIYLIIFPYYCFDNTHWSTQMIRIVLSLCIIVICCRYQQKWKPDGLGKILCLFGENSLAIYVLHRFFIDDAWNLRLVNMPYIAAIAAGLLAFAISGTCVVIARIISISSWWRKILFGK